MYENNTPPRLLYVPRIEARAALSAPVEPATATIDTLATYPKFQIMWETINAIVIIIGAVASSPILTNWNA